MTEEEVVRYIAIIPEYAEAHRAKDPAAMAEFYKRHGFTKTRYTYIQLKMASAAAAIENEPTNSPRPGTSNSLRLSNDEIEIAKRHYSDFTDAIERAQQIYQTGRQ